MSVGEIEDFSAIHRPKGISSHPLMFFVQNFPSAHLRNFLHEYLFSSIMQ